MGLLKKAKRAVGKVADEVGDIAGDVVDKAEGLVGDAAGEAEDFLLKEVRETMDRVSKVLFWVVGVCCVSLAAVALVVVVLLVAAL